MPDTLTLNSSLIYTPPAAPANSGLGSLAVTHTYNASAVGTIDVPNGTVVSTVIPVPFGSVSAAKTLIIKNNMTSEIGVRINGSVTNILNIPAGGKLEYSAPTAPVAVPITSASIVNTVDPTALERVQFFVFGD